MQEAQALSDVPSSTNPGRGLGTIRLSSLRIHVHVAEKGIDRCVWPRRGHAVWDDPREVNGFERAEERLGCIRHSIWREN